MSPRLVKVFANTGRNPRFVPMDVLIIISPEINMAAVIASTLPPTLGDTLAQSLARHCITHLHDSRLRQLKAFTAALRHSPGRHSRNASYQRWINFARAALGHCVVEVIETGAGKDRVTQVTGLEPFEKAEGRLVFRTFLVNARRPAQMQQHIVGAEISAHALQRVIQDIHSDDTLTLAKLLHPHAIQAARDVPGAWPVNREWLTVNAQGVGVWVRTPIPEGLVAAQGQGSPFWMLMATWIPAASATHGPHGRAIQRFRDGLAVNTLKC